MSSLLCAGRVCWFCSFSISTTIMPALELVSLPLTVSAPVTTLVLSLILEEQLCALEEITPYLLFFVFSHACCQEEKIFFCLYLPLSFLQRFIMIIVAHLCALTDLVISFKSNKIKRRKEDRCGYDYSWSSV